MHCGVQTTCTEIILRLLVIGLSNGAIIALNAVGVTLVYGVVRMINFAHGDLFALSTVIVFEVITRLAIGPGSPPLVLAGGLLVAVAAAMGFGVVLNMVIERMAFRPFRDRSRIAPLIATIGISFMLYQSALIARYATNIYIPGEHRSVPGVPEVPRGRIPDLLPRTNLLQAMGIDLDVRFTLKDVLLFVFALALALGVHLFLRRTRTGRALRACAQDPEMAQLCGVNRNHAIRLAFALGGGLAGAAAWIFTVYYTNPYTLYGAQSGLTAFAAAVLGGIGNPLGAFGSGLLFGIIGAFSDYFLAAQWTPVLLLSILIGLLLFRSSHLLSGGSEFIGEIAEAQQARGTRREQLLAGGLLLIAVAYPLLDSWFGWHAQLNITSVLVFALLALGLNITLGFAGLLDLGYAAFFAVGAYTAGLLTNPGSTLAALVPNEFIVVLLISGLVAGLIGTLNGVLTIRLRGEDLAIVTLAFGQIVPLVALNLNNITGGARGLAALPAPKIATFVMQTPLEKYAVAAGLVLLAAFFSQRLARSRIGRAWSALSADEAAAISCGVPAAREKCLAFGLGAAVAGMAGALFASSFSYVDPNQSEFRLSAMVLAMVIIGGAGSVPGAIIGAIIVAGLDQFAIPNIGAWLDSLKPVGGTSLLSALDIRTLNFLTFGIVLYLTILLRSRRRVSA